VQPTGLGLYYQQKCLSFEEILIANDRGLFNEQLEKGRINPDGNDFRSGKSFIFLAYQTNKPWALELLLNKGADPNKFISKKATMLQILSSEGADTPEVIEMGRILLSYGADPLILGTTNNVSSAQKNPVEAFFHNKNFQRPKTAHPLLKLLLRQWPPLPGKTIFWENDKARVLYITKLLTLTRNKEEIEVLLEEGACLDGVKSSPSELPPLHELCKNGAFKIARHLIKLGANPCQKDYVEWTPLHYLASCTLKQYPENVMESLNKLLKLVRDKGVFEIPDRRGYVAMFYCVNQNLVHAFCENGADPNIVVSTKSSTSETVQNSGSSPLTYAVINKNIALIQALLNNNADPNKRDLSGWTPIQIACKLPQPNYYVLNLLLKSGANVWDVNPLMKNALEIANANVDLPLDIKALLRRAERCHVSIACWKAFKSAQVVENSQNETSTLYFFPKNLFCQIVRYACNGVMITDPNEI